MNFEGKTVLVIGGTHGMGRASVEALLAAGAKVMATGSRAESLERLSRELPGVVPLRLDLGTDDDIATLPARLSADALDAILVFAATAEFGMLDQVTAEAYDRLFAINSRGVFFAIQGLLGHLQDGGSITLTTVTPATASPSMGIYMATKAAVGGWGRVLAAELLARRIRVNMLAPGFIETPTLGVPGLSDTERAELHAMGDAVTPMLRHGSMAEVARAALFLAFDATFSTGIELAVDGGISTVDAPWAKSAASAG